MRCAATAFNWDVPNNDDKLPAVQPADDRCKGCTGEPVVVCRKPCVAHGFHVVSQSVLPADDSSVASPVQLDVLMALDASTEGNEVTVAAPPVGS